MQEAIKFQLKHQITLMPKQMRIRHLLPVCLSAETLRISEITRRLTAQINGGEIQAGNIDVIAESTDNISAKAFGAGISGASVNAVVADVKTTNNTKASCDRNC